MSTAQKISKESFLKGIIYASALFCCSICILLIVNYLQLSYSSPITNQSLEALKSQYDKNPENQEIAKDIRLLDLMARKAYFTKHWQLRIGGYLLAFGLVVLILSIRLYNSFFSSLPEKEEVTNQPQSISTFRLQKWFVYTGAGILLLAVVSGFLSYNNISDFSAQQKKNILAEKTDTTKDSAIQTSTPEPEQNTVLQTDSSVTIAEIDSSLSSSAGIETQNEDAVKKITKVQDTISTPIEHKVKDTPAQKKEQTSVPDSELKNHHVAFRGYHGNGISSHKNIPAKWDGAAGSNMKWKIEIPKSGFSSPVIYKHMIFLTGADASERIIYCIDSKTGKLLWQHVAKDIAGSPAKPPKTTEDTGLAAPSATTNGTYVFAIFGTGDLLCLDFTGKRIWAKNLGVPQNHYGHSSSLVAYENQLFVQYDQRKNSMVYSMNCNTGDIIWQTSRNVKISWASPVLAKINNALQLILTSDPFVTGYDIANGKELWAIECMMGEVGPSVAVGESLIFAANEYAILAAIKPGSNAAITWQDDEYLPDVASPLAVNGILLITTSYGSVACYKQENGEKLWEKDFDNGFYGSPVFADGRMYMIDKEGITYVLEPGNELKITSENPTGEKVVSTPAFDKGHIYIRGLKHLYCFGE